MLLRFDDELGRGAAGGWPSEALHLLQQEEEVKSPTIYTLICLIFQFIQNITMECL